MAFVDYEKKNGVAIITMNRPERMNALSKALITELISACERFENDSEAKVAILTGKGRGFSAGADFNDVAQRQALIGSGADKVVDAMRKITKPVIAAINGFALGGGLWAMVLNSDIRIAAASAAFSLPEIALVIPMDPALFLAQNIPLSAAMELVLCDEPMSAQRAYDIGLVNKVVADEELMPAAMKMAERIARLSPWALGVVKKAKLEAVGISDRVWELPQRNQQILEGLAKSEEHKRAVKALIAKVQSGSTKT